MSNEQSSGREVIENGLKNLGSSSSSLELAGQLSMAAAAAAAGSPGPPSSPAAAAAAAAAAAGGTGASTAGSNEDVEASIRQLELQGRPAGEADSGGSSGNGAAAAAATGSAASSDVSQSRASSSIRVAKFHKLLNEPLVDLDALRELSWSGIPQELRPVCWRLLLGYLPPNKSRQASVLARKRREYLDMVPEFYDIENNQRTEEEVGALRQPAIQKSLERMLYIWGIRHPASGYVQGMNDLVTPFLAVFLSEALPGPMDSWTPDSLTEGVMLDVEADCYWCLSKLLEGIQDHYTYAQPGIQRTVFRVKELISKNNVAIVDHLDREGIDFLQFAFRWVNCILIREVPFAAAIRLWDTYLAEGGRFADFLVYVCAAFLACWQKDILGLEFQELMMFLQKLPTQDWQELQIESVLSNAYVLRNTWGNAQSHLQL
ncbi:rab-GTPase-TBC domain-containing protein [Scenedesmus sp. NREL 46B-D3]|nr:rab-GTPase-TBC domain-containing protein [Scenedesmus sp. NREL 46B-D3]